MEKLLALMPSLLAASDKRTCNKKGVGREEIERKGVSIGGFGDERLFINADDEPTDRAKPGFHRGSAGIE